MKSIKDIKDKILKHDKKVNEQEIEILNNIKGEIERFKEKLNEIMDYIKYLEDFNIYEIYKKPRLKEEEIEILYNLYMKYRELSESFSNLYEKILRYYKTVKREII
ncbi:MAG: hypothetical protein BXU00_01605 [Candidatus Nanoclepta minutus]|uniref:Uncharacterized protein n=1 Tax=Candidatus Nanoclepta minutus TaxID=1940235 RepID=A0A397WNG7_9ARCH|nr:MAG: hypothetical protein BXU00_01605 [Candidatus Nanoclepta minutus]